MDEESDDYGYTRDLYQRFRQEVMDGGPVGYYEKDELLDIYDYAQDEGDVTVQFFVLQTAARLYPEDKTLEERAGFFVSYISSDAGADMLKRKGRGDSPLWDVLDIGLRNYPDGDPEKDLEALLERRTSLDTESVIKLVDLLRDMDRPDLLEKHSAALRERAEDPKALLYEVAETLRNYEAHIPAARQAAEELTRDEPFNQENWVLLGRIELGMGKRAEAISAAEYALAIEPDYADALLLRAGSQIPDEATRPEAETYLESVINSLKEGESPNPAVLRALGEGYVLDGHKAKAADLYLRFYRVNPLDTSLAHEILALEADQGRGDQAIEIFAGQTGEDEGGWLGLAESLGREGHATQAERVLDGFVSRYGQEAMATSIELYVCLLYEAGSFDKLIRFFVVESALTDKGVKRVGGDLLLFFASALLRTGRYKEAAEMASTILRDTPPLQGLDALLRHKGVQVTAKLIHSLATNRQIHPIPANLDPMQITLKEG